LTFKLSEELRQQIVSKLAIEPSDTLIAKEFGVHRKTVWRLRQTCRAKTDEIIPPPKEETKPVKIPPSPLVPDISERSIPAPRPEKTKISEQVQEAKVSPSILSPELNTYFAVQMMRWEHYKEVVQVVLMAAAANKILFRKIQVLDVSTVGATSFVRFRSDVEDASAIVKSLEKRAFIIKENDAFMIHFPDDRVGGKYPTFSMCSTPKVGFGHTFVGTKVARWKNQFQDQAN